MTADKIVVIEDNDDTFFLVSKLLEDIGYQKENIIRCAQFHEVTRVDPREVAVVLTDLSLPDSPYRLTFTKVNEHFAYNPIVILTGTSELEVAVNTLKRGAQDYLIKGEIDAKTLKKAIVYAIERKKLSNDYKRLFRESPLPMYIFDSSTYRFLVVNDAALKQYQYTRDEFMSMTALDIRPEKDWPGFYKMTAAVTDDYFDAGVWTHVRKNGEEFRAQIYAHSIEFEGKQAIMVLANDLDKKLYAGKEDASAASHHAG